MADTTGSGSDKVYGRYDWIRIRSTGGEPSAHLDANFAYFCNAEYYFTFNARKRMHNAEYLVS